MRLRTPATMLLLVLAGAGVPSAQAAPTPDSGPQPYFAPPFADDCTVHHYGEGKAPDPATATDDPYCVEYRKRDITLDDGGAVAFLLAEPARFAAAGGKCAYWQQDHWSVQASRGQTAVIRWDGSYWYDQGAGQAASRVSHLTIGGEPATLKRAAREVAPYSPQLAAYFRRYGRGGDGMGYAQPIPFDPACA